MSTALKGSRFVSEKEIEEKKKVRQAEWEKVRKPDQPLQCPEEPADHRTLYERLQEQKLKAQEEQDEAKKLKNFVRGLEHDEVEFLDNLDDIYVRMELEKRQEEKNALKEFHEKLAAVSESSVSSPSLLIPAKRKDPPGTSTDFAPRKSQKNLLAGVVRLKSRDDSEKAPATASKDSSKSEAEHSASEPQKPGLSVGLKLLTAYESSSDSE